MIPNRVPLHQNIYMNTTVPFKQVLRMLKQCKLIVDGMVHNHRHLWHPMVTHIEVTVEHFLDNRRIKNRDSIDKVSVPDRLVCKSSECLVSAHSFGAEVCRSLFRLQLTDKIFPRLWI